MTAMTNKKDTRVAQDGITHINVGMSTPTRLGQLLAHYKYTPFNVPGLGPFNSMGAYWWFIKTSGKTDEDVKERNRLRTLSGKAARDAGKSGKLIKTKGFRELIAWGMWNKVTQNPEIESLLKESTLPIEIYWLEKDSVVEVYPIGWDWQSEVIMNIRYMLQHGEVMKMPDIEDCLTEEFGPSHN